LVCYFHFNFLLWIALQTSPNVLLTFCLNKIFLKWNEDTLLSICKKWFTFDHICVNYLTIYTNLITSDTVYFWIYVGNLTFKVCTYNLLTPVYSFIDLFNKYFQLSILFLFYRYVNLSFKYCRIYYLSREKILSQTKHRNLYIFMKNFFEAFVNYPPRYFRCPSHRRWPISAFQPQINVNSVHLRNRVGSNLKYLTRIMRMWICR